MRLTFHFDLPTLVATQVIICLVFAISLYGLHRGFRHVQGAAQLALSFLCAALSAAVFLVRPDTPLLLNVLLTNSLLLLASLLFYHAVDSVLGIRARLRIPVIVSIVALLIAVYFTSVHDLILIRAALFSFANSVIVSYMLADLAICPRRKGLVRLLAGTMAFYLLTIFVRAIALVTRAQSAGLPTQDLIGPLYMVVGILMVCSVGILAIAVVGSEIAASIEQNARRDHLTDSLNRRGIEEMLASELGRARRSATPMSIALIDVDHFKSVNDAGGHAAGDDTLRSIAASIAAHLRPYDSCGRLGGDEFLILLPGSQASDAAQVCERILHHIAALPRPLHALQPVTVSIGFTESHPTDTSETILARADRALYSAKRDGRNCAHMDLVFLRNMPSEPALPTVVPTGPVRTSNLRNFRKPTQRPQG